MYEIFSENMLESIQKVGAQSEKIDKCCRVCSHYQPIEISDSDYGPMYSDEYECTKELDTTNDGKLNKRFNRERQRNCCQYDFFKVLGTDYEIAKLFEKVDMISNELNIDSWKSYKRFKEKYKSKWYRDNKAYLNTGNKFV